MALGTFTGWPVEAVEFYEGLAADNTKSYWHAHKFVYEQSVRAPMEALLAELGGGKVFRPYRDTRFSKDKSPYKTSCDAHTDRCYLSLSAEGLFVGSGLYMPSPEQLARFRAAVADDRSGPELEALAAALRAAGYDVGAHEVLKTAPRGYPKDHPRVDLLRHKGLTIGTSWPVGAWLGTPRPKDRIVAFLAAAEPLAAWLHRHTGTEIPTGSA